KALKMAAKRGCVRSILSGEFETKIFVKLLKPDLLSSWSGLREDGGRLAATVLRGSLFFTSVVSLYVALLSASNGALRRRVGALSFRSVAKKSEISEPCSG